MLFYEPYHSYLLADITQTHNTGAIKAEILNHATKPTYCKMGLRHRAKIKSGKILGIAYEKVYKQDVGVACQKYVNKIGMI